MTSSAVSVRPARRLRLGLLDRVTIAFGLVALAISLTLSLATWSSVSHYLIHGQESSDISDVVTNAAALQPRLHDVPFRNHGQVARLLDSLPRAHSSAFLSFREKWYSTEFGTGPRELPAELVDEVKSGSAAEQRSRLDGRPVLAVGIPLGGRNAYFEIFSLDSIDRSLKTLSLSLVAGGVGVVVVGLVLGRLAGRRALRPLTRFIDSARAVAAGDLGARVPESQDSRLSGLASSFNATADALERRMIADARFAADVSHELRTPVTTMVNSMQLITAYNELLPDDVREPVELLATDLDRFRRLVVDLLEISRDERPGAADDRESVRIAELVRHAVALASGNRAEIAIAVSAEAERVVMDVDKRRLERAIANLVENAQRHGGGCCGVRIDLVSGAAGHRSVRIFVDDKGSGIPAELRERIFDRFARGTASDGQGVGLGLAIVARHVRWHGGAVRVQERPGGGARFVVELPVDHTRAVREPV